MFTINKKSVASITDGMTRIEVLHDVESDKYTIETWSIQGQRPELLNSIQLDTVESAIDAFDVAIEQLNLGVSQVH